MEPDGDIHNNMITIKDAITAAMSTYDIHVF